MYLLLLVVLLAGFGVFVAATLHRNLQDVRVSGLRNDLDEAQRVLQRVAVTPTPRPGQAPPPRRTTLDDVRAGLCNQAAPAGARTAAAQALASAVAQVGGGTVSVLVMDRRLAVLAHAPADTAVDAIPRLSSPPLDAALAGRAPDSDVLDGADGPQLSVALPLFPNGLGSGQACAVAQLGISTEPTDTVVSRTVRLLLVGSAVVLGVALIAGLVLVSRTLRPLRRLTDTARRLAGGDLRARSGLTPRDDEVGTLAHTFDEMAERIEASFTAQTESEARMRRFVADASHELRTPVTALKGYIDVLRRGVSRDPEALDAALAAMARESERMRILVLDLLTLARLDAARNPSPEPVDVDTVVAEVLDEGAEGMPATLALHLGAGGAEVLADRGSLATIARNLLVNACKYAPGARQEWSTRVDDGHVELRVTDDGPGIAASDLPHVFERFYRGEKTRAREEGGSGLGLSIVQGLARSLGGDATIESIEGSGTTVTVRLPTTATA